MKRKFIIIFISLVVIICLGILVKTKVSGQKDSQFTIVSPKLKTLKKEVSTSGKIIAGEEVDLKFQASGLLSWIGVKEGDRVEKWQVIASLDTRELKKRLEKSLRDYSKERNDFEEDRRDTYKNTLYTDTVKRILEKNQFDLDKAVMDVELNDITLQFASLITPIAGIVTHADVSISGINITPATATFTVSDPNSLIYRANIDEADIGQIKKGQEVEIILDAYSEEPVNGKIDKIGFSSETTSGGSNAYPVEIPLPANTGLKYKIGMNGDANIVTKQVKNAIVIPIDSIFKSGNNQAVYLLQNGNKVKKEVKTGLETDEEIEIKEGLTVNDKVVINK